MQFIDLTSQQKRIRKKIDQNISKVLDRGKYINGSEVRELEKKLADYVGVQHAVGCSNGTDALLMALLAYKVKPGDAIFTTTFSFISTAEMVVLLNATPVFVDIEPDTFNIDVNKLEENIKKVLDEGKLKPRGIIPVDIFGQTADYDEINRIAKEYNLFVIEDAAQSFGATCKGRRACSLADIGITSFYPAKPLGCYGDGGMIFTDNKDTYHTLISLREHGRGNGRYSNARIGINGRLDSIQAAVVLAKFDIFEEELAMRQIVSNRYKEGIAGLDEIVITPYIKEHNKSAWALYSVLSSKREELMAALQKADIPCVVYYPKPLHLQGAFSHLNYSAGSLPVSEDVTSRILSLPMHPYLEKKDQDRVIEAIKSI